MKTTLRKITAVLLSLIICLSVSSVAFAADKVTPVIIVSGMNAFPLTMAETGEQVWPIQTDSILSVVKENIRPMTEFLITRHWQKLGDEVIGDVYKALFEKVACDENGDSVYDIETRFFPESLDNYPEEFENAQETVSEIGISKSVMKEIGAENVYYFNYDWRLSPMKHADNLNDFVEKVKKDKGVSEVTLIPCSMGGTVTNAYLYKYGSDSVKKVIYVVSAIQGLSSVGEMFNRNIDVDVDTIMNYIFSIQKDNLKMQIIMALVSTLVEVTPCITKLADRFIDDSLIELNDRVYDELMIDSMGKFPGWWALVPDEYYDSGKEIFFGGKIPANFEALIDSYHYNVQRCAENLMNSVADNGTDVYVLSSYGYVGTPYTDQAMTQTDGLIETHYQSGRAVTAPYGETFPKGYEALGRVCGDKSHNHVSTDGIVDASTCFFPENTWFIKYNRHVGIPCDTDCAKLLMYLVTSDTYVTVHSNEKYPQFVELNRISGEFTSLTGSDFKKDYKDGESSFLVRAIIIADTFWKNIRIKLSF